jgi:hypothetical protein
MVFATLVYRYLVVTIMGMFMLHDLLTERA